MRSPQSELTILEFENMSTIELAGKTYEVDGEGFLLPKEFEK